MPTKLILQSCNSRITYFKLSKYVNFFKFSKVLSSIELKSKYKAKSSKYSNLFNPDKNSNPYFSVILVFYK